MQHVEQSGFVLFLLVTFRVVDVGQGKGSGVLHVRHFFVVVAPQTPDNFSVAPQLVK
jgi:hypothetical protein